VMWKNKWAYIYIRQLLDLLTF